MGLLCSNNYTVEERDMKTSRVTENFLTGYDILMKNIKTLSYKF